MIIELLCRNYEIRAAPAALPFIAHTVNFVIEDFGSKSS